MSCTGGGDGSTRWLTIYRQTPAELAATSAWKPLPPRCVVAMIKNGNLDDVEAFKNGILAGCKQTRMLRFLAFFDEGEEEEEEVFGDYYVLEWEDGREEPVVGKVSKLQWCWGVEKEGVLEGYVGGRRGELPDMFKV